MVMIEKIINQPIVSITAKAALIYGMVYAGRIYLAINPLQAALFSIATSVIIKFGLLISKNFNLDPNSKKAEAMFFSCTYLSTAFSMISGVFSPTQAITSFFLFTLSNDLCHVIADIYL